MFSTLRYDKESKAVQWSHDAHRSRGACKNCRARKLRCSGQRTGCDRCQSRKTACEYPEPRKRLGPHQRAKEAPAVQDKAHSGAQKEQFASPARPAAPNPSSDEQSTVSTIESSTSSLPSLAWTEAAAPLDLLETDFDLDGLDSLLGPDVPLSNDRDELTRPPGDFEMDMLDASLFPALEGDPLALALPQLPGSDATADSFFSRPTTAADSSASYDSSLVPSPTASAPHSLSAFSQSTRLSSLSSCQCLTNASCLLENLNIEAGQLTLSRVARVLYLKKRILSQFTRLLSCPLCTGLSHYVSLLIVLCQRMTSSFVDMLDILSEHYQRVQTRRNSDATGCDGFDNAPLPFGENKQNQQIMVQDYEMDMEEQPCLLGALLFIQLKKLKTLLRRMKTTARSWNWDSHIKIIDGIEWQVAEQLAKYDKCHFQFASERAMDAT